MLRAARQVRAQRMSLPTAGPSVTGNSVLLPSAGAADQGPRYEQPGEEEPDETPPAVGHMDHYGGSDRDACQHGDRRRCRSARTTSTAGTPRSCWPGLGVRAGWREDLPADPSAHPRSARPGPAPSARRTPRPSACPPGSAHSGPTRPHHGRNQKPSFQQEDNSRSWRSSGSRLSISCRRKRVSHISNVLDKSHRRHCRMPPAGDDICHGAPGWARTEQVEAAARGEAGPDEGRKTRTWRAASRIHSTAVHSGRPLAQSDLARRSVFWTYCLKVRQWLARLEGPRGRQEAGLASGACSLVAADQGRRGCYASRSLPGR